MSDYKKLKMGICDKCEGNIQFDKENNYYYCMSCHKLWDESDWDCYMMAMQEEEYKPFNHLRANHQFDTNDEMDNNLSGLNNL